MKKRIEVFYSGKVQGVGFRYTVLDLARSLRVCGWVKNHADGRVELVAEGSPDSLESLLGRIQSIFDRYIADSRVDWLPATGEFRDFSIVF